MSNANAQAFPDLDFDAIPDLPAFAVPPAGHYKLKLTILSKTINAKQAVEFGYEVVEILEQADPTEAPAKIGDKFSCAYFLDNEFSLGKLKADIAPLQAFCGQKQLAAVAEQCQGLSVYGVVKVRRDKNDADKKYASVSSLTVE